MLMTVMYSNVIVLLHDYNTNDLLIIFDVCGDSLEMKCVEFDTLSFVELALELHPE
jgi:quinolinate synthase